MDRPRSLAIVAALPRELAPLARELAAVRVFRRDGIELRTATASPGAGEVLLVSAGMGAARVSLAVQAALAHNAAATLVSAGFAGACDPALKTGTLFAASLVIDSRTGERLGVDAALTAALQGAAVAPLASSALICGIGEKRRLLATYGAGAVDMEAATVARLAVARGLPFAALKAISDGADDDLAALRTFTGPRGEFRTGRFVLHAALRPAQWRNVARLGSNSAIALRHLTEGLLRLVASGTPNVA